MAENTIERAIEFLMGRYEIDANAAQALLEQLSTRHSMADVARRLINSSSSTPTTRGHTRAGCRLEEATMEPVSGNDDIHVQIAALIRDIYARSPAVETAIDEIIAAASKFVPGAQYAGVTVIARHNHIHTPSASGCYPRLLDRIQNRYHQGPCLEAIHQQRTVRVDDLSTEIRWPNYRQDALSQTPIRSVLSIAMSANRRTLGALTLYADQPHAFDTRAENLGFVYATHAALAWNSLRRELQFRRALVSRDVISQAKGMLMERDKIGSAEAFERLRELSQNSNIPVTEIARGLIKEHFA